MGRSNLVDRPLRHSLRCPVCGLYTTPVSAAGALRSLSCHLTMKHPQHRAERRYCNGPLHDGKPTLLPLSEFGSKGHHCRACIRYVYRDGRNAGLVPVDRVLPFVDALVSRCGSQLAAAKAAGVAHTAISKVRRGETRMMQRGTAAKIMQAVRGLQEV